jgi:formiminotetrahydrofolate cyclodeaminase
MSIFDQSLNEYLENAASKKPEPGSASVSAVVAANAAAMIRMAADLTINKKGYENVQSAAEEIALAAAETMTVLKKLAIRDIEVVRCFMSVQRMPQTTEEQMQARSIEMEKALQNASTMPCEICKTCLRVLELAARLAPIVNKNVLSEVGTAAHIADGAMKACMLNIDSNLRFVAEPSFKSYLLEQKTILLSSGEKQKDSAISEIERRLGL